MSMKSRLKQPRVMQMIGLALLVVASAVRQIMQSRHGASDGLVGLLYGAAIGALLLSLWLRGRGARERE
jgi:ABC-type cobalamin transport system permease subunit